MKKILFVNACARPESRTLILARHVLDTLEGEVEEVCLAEEPIPVLDWQTVQQREASIARQDFSDPLLRYVCQFTKADEIVIAAPYWDLMFPAALKVYLEAVTVCGVSFYYTEQGVPQGLCRAQRITYVTTAGGPILNLNWGYDYIRSLAQTFYGIPEVRCYQAENLDIIGADVHQILSETIQKIQIENTALI